MAAVVPYPHEHPLLPLSEPPAESTDELRKISAYYSLVFPNFTYYLQTLNVTIGRRCTPASGSSSQDTQQVDVDLGPLKSVSRLHAKIEYEEDEERFVLIVVGRNGAWVDGVWSGSGSKVPLGERSQIQIASRTFHFILPPPPAPEDSPSPSSQSSVNPPRSPSVDIVDITSLSPASSLPSASPPPPAKIKIPPLGSTALPNSNTIVAKTNGKKRKKSDAHAQPPLASTEPPPPPDVMPLKPQLTYAQLCYRAIKALSGKASLQEICQWIRDTHEWYKYNSKGWESSVRHNLSSNPGFKKLARGKDEKGKGALWTIEDAYEHTFEEQESKRQASLALASGGGKEGKSVIKKGKNVVPLDPPFKRSVKGDLKGAPLPPPLTSTPLPLRTNVQPAPHAGFASGFNSAITPPVKPPSGPSSALTSTVPSTSVSSNGTVTPIPEASTSASAISPFPAIPASVRLPIVVGSVPGAEPSPPQSKPIVLHENTLILNPEIFSDLLPQHLRDLEALGAQKALEILQSYIVRYYKEKLKAEGGRGRGRGKPRRGLRGGMGGRGAAMAARADQPNSGPFTTAPLPPRPTKPLPPPSGGVVDGQTPNVDRRMVADPPMGSLQPDPTESAPSPIVIIDDDDPPEPEPAAKRRKLEDGDGAVAAAT